MSITKLTQEQVVEHVKDILTIHTCLDEKDDGTYECEIYADSQDELHSSTLEEIFKSKNPREKFDEMISEWYQNSEFEIEAEIFNIVRDRFGDEDNSIFYDDYAEFINGWIKARLFFKYPHDHYLKQDVYVDIITNTGDGNYDYTMNNLFRSSYNDTGYEANSSVIWLMKQQGYSKRQIKKFIEKGNYQGSKFLESVYKECINTSSSMNALTFFVAVTLDEYFNLCSTVESKDKVTRKKLILEKGTPCGLYDPWNGAGSVLEIELEKDVVLPLKFVDSAYPDGKRGYGVASIYGSGRSLWKSDCVKIA